MKEASFSLKFLNKGMCLQHGLFLLLPSFSLLLGEFNKHLEWSRVNKRQKEEIIWEAKQYEEKLGGKES